MSFSPGCLTSELQSYLQLSLGSSPGWARLPPSLRLPLHQKAKSQSLLLFSLSFLDRSVALGLWCPPLPPARHHLLHPGLACSPRAHPGPFLTAVLPSLAFPHHTQVCTHTHKGHSLVFHSSICPLSLPPFVLTLFRVSLCLLMDVASRSFHTPESSVLSTLWVITLAHIQRQQPCLGPPCSTSL